MGREMGKSLQSVQSQLRMVFLPRDIGMLSNSSICRGFLLALLTSGVSAQTPTAVASGNYECWGNGAARLLLNFKVTGKDRYSDPEGKERGSFVFDPVTGAIAFKGGHLDGVMPKGFTTIYHEPRKIPTVSFRSARGAEASFCERAGR